MDELTRLQEFVGRGDTIASRFLAELERVSPAIANNPAIHEDFSDLADLFTKGRQALAEGYVRWYARHGDEISASPMASAVTLFGPMDESRRERAQTMALAWLLDGNNPTHGFGWALLEGLLTRLRNYRKRSEHCFSKIFSVESAWVTPEYRAGEFGRIDVYVEGTYRFRGREVRSFIVAMEAKIDAPEGDAQTTRYDEFLDRKHGERDVDVFRVFVSPSKRDIEAESGHWQKVSFLELGSVLWRAARDNALQDRQGAAYLRLYVAGLFQDLEGIPLPITGVPRDIYRAIKTAKAAGLETEGLL